MLMTMSISCAPQRTASRASNALAVGVIAPSGKPTTAHTITPEPSRNADALATFVEFTHTDAKQYLRASSHSFLTSAAVASALSSVWSIMPAIWTSTLPTSTPAPTRQAPSALRLRTDQGRRDAHIPQPAQLSVEGGSVHSISR